MPRSNSARNQDYFICLGYLIPLLNHVERQKGQIESLLQLLGVVASDLNCTDKRLPDRLIDPLFDEAATLCGDEAIGLHAGQQMTFNHVGILGPLVLTCTKASQVFNLHQRYQLLVGNGALSHYQVDHQHVTLRFRGAPGRSLYTRHLYEFNLAGWMRLLSTLAGEVMRPDRAEFPIPAPVDLRPQQEAFQCELVYGQGEEMRLFFERHHFEHLLFAGDSSLRQSMEAAAQQRLLQLHRELADPADEWLPTLQRFVRQQLAHGVPAIEHAAAACELPVRTLQRRLNEHGSSYQALVDDVRKASCQSLMQQPLSLLDIALMLGFSAQSSFHRSFKRWFGCTPASYRASEVD